MAKEPSVQCRMTGILSLSVNETAKVSIKDGALLVSNSDHNSPELYLTFDVCHAAVLMQYARLVFSGQHKPADNE